MTFSVDQLKHLPDEKLKLKDLGQIKHFLGLEVVRSPQGISLRQCKYVLEILQDTSFLSAKPVSFSME